MSTAIGNISRRSFLVGSAAASLSVGLPSFAAIGEESTSQLSCEVLVCAATPAGIAAAVTAARLGRKVVLVEYEDHIGGIVSNGLTIADLRKRSAVGGFFNRFQQRINDYYRESHAGSQPMPNLHPWYQQVPEVTPWGGGAFYEPHVAEAIFNQFVLEQSSNLRVILRHELKQAIVERNRVTGLVFEPRDQPGQHVRIHAEVTIDATYEGDVAGLAGAHFRLGRESREEFHEPHAGRIYMHFGSNELLPGSTGEGDKAIQSFCFRFSATTDPANQVPVEKPDGYDRNDYQFLLEDIRGGKLTKLGQVFGVFKMPNGKVQFNSQNPLPETGLPSESLDLAEECWPWPEATWAVRRKIFDRYLTHNVGMLWLLQNDSEITPALQQDARRYGWCKDEFTTNHHLPRQIYVREGRRIDGVYFLTQNDDKIVPGLERTQLQPTSIGLVEWPYDSHGCHRYDPAHPGTREGYTFVSHAPFQIPYGVVVPRSVDGLLVPVACSASHVAYNALRNEPIFMVIGEACGHAASLAVQKKVAPRNVPVDRLQRALVEDGGVITYLEDLESSNEAFAACQWLGARGLNTGYRAETQKTLTKGEGAGRFQRIAHAMNLRETISAGSDPAAPLTMVDVSAWLQSVGFHSPSVNPNTNLRTGITVEEFATQLYRAMTPPAA